MSLRNVRTDRPNKKLDNRSIKFTVIEVVSPSVYRLDILPSIYNVFNIDFLRPTADDPLPSQVVDDPQPPAVLVDDEEKWQVEKILRKRQKKLLGRGRRTRLEYLVKWQGYADPI